MRAVDGVRYASISTDQTFKLNGGVYTMDAVATWGGGNVALKRLGPDGSTYLSLDSALTLSANGTSGPVALPPGDYQLDVTTATALYVSVVRTPGE